MIEIKNAHQDGYAGTSTCSTKNANSFCMEDASLETITLNPKSNVRIHVNTKIQIYHLELNIKTFFVQNVLNVEIKTTV